MRTRRFTCGRVARVVGGVAAVASLLAGCGADDGPAGSPSGDGAEATGTAAAFVSREKSSVAGASRFDIYFTQPGTSAATGSDPIVDDDLVALIGAAKTSISAALYDFDRQNVIGALVAARGRGVEVRLVGDGDNLDEAGYVQAAAAGIPMVVRPAGSAIMHDKFIVVDDRYLFTGSMNASDNDVLRNNNDALILEDAAMAAAYRAEFEEMFTGHRFGPAKSDVTTSNTTTIDGVPVEFYVGPRDALMAQLLAKLDTAGTSVRFLIFTFAKPELKDALIAKKNAGVAVYGVFDQLQAGQGYSQDDALAAAGVRTFIDGNANYGSSGGALLHHKVMILDGETASDPMVVTGSFNWTDAASSDNDENLVVIHSGAVARAYLEEFCAVASVATVHPASTGPTDRGCGGKIVVNEALPNPVGTDLGQEYVEIVNTGVGAVDLGGYTLSVGGSVKHTFASGWTLPGGAVSVVYDQGAHATTPGAVASTSGNLGLTNSGATVTLKDGAGTTMDVFTYGATSEGVAQNRRPDAAPGGVVVAHDLVEGAHGAASPGLRADQSAFTGVGAVSGTAAAAPAAHELLITQFATRGPASAADEFVEVYNASDRVLDVGGLRVQYEPASCSGWSDRHTVPSGTRLTPGQFYLVASSGYSGAATASADGALGGSGFADNGLLRVVDAAGGELDKVAYGVGLTCRGEGGTVAPNHGTLANGDTVARRPGSFTNAAPAQDGDDNAADFAVQVGRAPRSAVTVPQPSKGVVRPGAGQLLVSQFATRGLTSAADEFVEVYNATSAALTIDGVRIQYQTSSCGSWSDRHTVGAGTTLLPGQFYLAANPTGYVTPASGPAANGALSTAGLSDSASIRLLGAAGQVLDLVAYGTGLACTGEGGTVAPGQLSAASAPNGASVGRHAADSGAVFSKAAPIVDANDNVKDFAVRAVRSPRDSASPAQPSR